MKSGVTVERSLLFLAGGASVVVGAMLAAFFWIQSVLVSNQHYDKHLIGPVRAAVREMRDELNAMLARQARLASAKTAAEVETAGNGHDRGAALASARERLANILLAAPELPSTTVNPDVVLAEISGQLTRFIENDLIFYEANLELHQREEQLAQLLREVYQISAQGGPRRLIS